MLVAVAPTCSALGAIPPAQGGDVLEGTYALQAYQLPFCFAVEQTLRITLMAGGLYRIDTVASLGATRASASMVRDGAVLRTTSICGATEVDEPYAYSAFVEDDQRFLRLIRPDEGVFTFRRLGP